VSDNSIAMLMVVAKVLNRLPQPVVYTGGATIPLYLDALSARDMRPTDDVDCVVEVTSQREYYRLSATLRELGLSEDSSPGAPLCRWLCQGVKLDVMPIDPRILGFGNRWYERGVAESIDFVLPDGVQIKIFTIAYLLASKIEAFGSRGKNQFYFSKDFEDIITLFNGSPSLVAEITASESEVKTFITAWVRTERKNLDAMAPAFLTASDRLAGRDKLLLETIDLLAGLRSD
jgi:hypothetical protein